MTDKEETKAAVKATSLGLMKAVKSRVRRLRLPPDQMNFEEFTRQTTMSSSLDGISLRIFISLLFCIEVMMIRIRTDTHI